ncbi:F0F1 ATP synthase subunit delta [Candidatus Saccharibacteria bacterium]|nr:F0F1 ATP synthase subunit delta [Candidatus Saccharibacteria bacterium]
MTKVSRRALARYGAQQLLAGNSARQIAKQLAALLTEAGRVGEANFLLEDIAWELERNQELAVGKVITAHPLSTKLAAELKAQLKQATGARQVLLEAEVDKSVLGGLRLQTADKVWDSTVSRKLSELREVF